MASDSGSSGTQTPESSLWGSIANIAIAFAVLITVMVVYFAAVYQMDDSNEVTAALTQVLTVISTLTAVFFGVRAGAQGKEKVEANLMEMVQATKTMSNARVSDMHAMAMSIIDAEGRTRAQELSSLNANITRLAASIESLSPTRTRPGEPTPQSPTPASSSLAPEQFDALLKGLTRIAEALEQPPRE